MFFLRPVGPSGLDPTASTHTQATACSNVVVCPPMMWQAPQTAESWHAIYRLAYEQLVTAFAPSPFQRALEPSLN
jgi:hypothetical protein